MRNFGYDNFKPFSIILGFKKLSFLSFCRAARFPCFVARRPSFAMQRFCGGILLQSPHSGQDLSRLLRVFL